MTDQLRTTLLTWLAHNAGRITFFIAVIAVALAAVKVLSKVLTKVLNHANVPSVSIFVNITRVLIWSAAITIVLQPVFGINPTTLITALGVGGVAISLGMQDTISNIISGFGLMLGKVIQPGDYVTIQGTTGIVKDITWRQTVIQERGGNEMVIPNSVLNTSSLERITPATESCVTIPFIAKSDIDPAQVEAKIIEAVSKATEGMCQPDNPPLVKFTGFSAYGVTGNVLLFANFDQFTSTVANAAARALIGADYLEQHGGAIEE